MQVQGKAMGFFNAGAGLWHYHQSNTIKNAGLAAVAAAAAAVPHLEVGQVDDRGQQAARHVPGNEHRGKRKHVASEQMPSVRNAPIGSPQL